MEMWRRIIGETQGTAFLAFIVIVSNGNPYAISLGLWVNIIGLGFIGGAHFNPVVTLACLSKMKFFKTLTKAELSEYLRYLISQILGAFLGTVFGFSVNPSSFGIKIGENHTVSQAYSAEVVFTGQMVLVILVVCHISESKLVSSLAVSISVLSGILTVGGISGACFNPTICLTIDIYQSIAHSDTSYIENA